jgi:protein-tyrosine-phosphatase
MALHAKNTPFSLPEVFFVWYSEAMKVLFVCSGNIGRSQVAMEYFKRFTGNDASSAGTRVSIENEKIGDREDAQVVLQGYARRRH